MSFFEPRKRLGERIAESKDALADPTCSVTRNGIAYVDKLVACDECEAKQPWILMHDGRTEGHQVCQNCHDEGL